MTFLKGYEQMKRLIAVLLSLCLLLALAACGGNSTETSETSGKESSSSADPSSDTSGADVSTPQPDESGVEPQESEDVSQIVEDEYFTKFDQTTSYDSDDTTIVFDGSSVTVSGVGATANGSFVTITAAGTYVVSGRSTNGQIIVEVPKTDKVRLVFNGLDLICSKSAPVWVKSADKVAVTLADGTENFLTDGKTYVYDNADNEPNACLFSKDDLTVNGGGSLEIKANNNNGIGTKNGLRIFSGNITVSAAKNALKGNDSVAINSGVVINITKCKDGIKTDNTEEVLKGFVYIRGGDISITASDDGIQATRKVTVEGGNITVSARSNVINCDGEVKVAKDVITEK
jgi:hypothetical protein